MIRILWTLATIAAVLVAFGAFGWLGFAIGVMVVWAWWTTGDEDDLP